MGIHAVSMLDKDLYTTAEAMISYFAEMGVTLTSEQERIVAPALHHGIDTVVYGPSGGSHYRQLKLF